MEKAEYGLPKRRRKSSCRVWKIAAWLRFQSEYQIHQTQYYKWREQFLENISKVFETKAQSKKEERLESENQKLKTIVGELHMELKKNDW